MIKVIISGSRHSSEREIIKELFNRYLGNEVHCYDCNEYVTDVTRQGKQDEINERIRGCDWYVLVANSERYGDYTKMEWETIMDELQTKSYDKLITVVKCENPEDSSKIQNINDVGKYTFADFEQVRIEKGIGEQFFLQYKFHDENFDSLKNVVREEIEMALSRNIVMRKLSKAISEVTPSDIFVNQYRIRAENGFDENFYLKRSSVDNELDRCSGFVVLTGAPASGKTRAVYEFLKRLHQAELNDGNPHSRMVKVDNDSLPYLVNAVENIDTWRRELNAASELNLSDYVFVIDQIIDVLRDPENMKLFNRLHGLAVTRLNARMIATSLIEPYKLLCEDDRFLPDPVEIKICRLDGETDYNFKEALKDYINTIDNGNQIKAVIGDHIPGLKNYNDTIIRAVERSASRREIECFVKAFNVICMFRKGNIWPIGLVLAVTERIYGQKLSDENFKNGLMQFFLDNNILHVQSTNRYKPVSVMTLDHEKLFSYDGEMLKMLVPANYLMSIDNDYVWQFLRKQKYAINWKNQEEMETCMKWYCDAFFNEAPVATLRRVIVRSPAVGLALKYRANQNFIKIRVVGMILDLFEGNHVFDQQEMKMLIAFVLHRSSTLEELKEDYEMFVENTNGKFYLDEDVVAELMGFAQYLSTGMQKRLLEFISSKGWDFSSDGHLSIYYHKRMIQYLNSFSEIKEYMTKHVLVEGVLKNRTVDPDMDKINRRDLLKTIIRKCRDVRHVEQVLDWADDMNVVFDKDFFYSLCTSASTNLSMSDKNNMELLDVLDNFFSDGQTSGFSMGQITYYLVRMANCFVNARDIFERHEAELDDNPSLKARVISAMLDSAKNYEFAYIYRFFFKDGKLVRKLPQVSRNRLLRNLDFNSAMSAFELLFDSSDYDSTPDLHTMISLLKVNVDFHKSAIFKEKTGKQIVEHVYQNLLQILHHPYMKRIGRIDPALPLIIQCCISESQEQYVLDHYVKPRYMAFLKMRSPEMPETALKVETDNYMGRKMFEPEIAVSKIRRRNDRDMKQILRYVIDVMDGTFRTQSSIDPDVFNGYCQKLFSLMTPSDDGCLTIGEFNEYRNRMADYILDQIVISGDGTPIRRFDYLIKDEYFYPAYYKVYPEKIIKMDGNRYVVSEEELHSIPADFITEKLISHIFQGTALVMGAEALKDVETWFRSNLEDYHWESVAYRFVKKLYPEYDFQTDRLPKLDENMSTYRAPKQHEVWNFLNDYLKGESDMTEEKIMEQIDAIKDEYPDSIPSISLIHELFKKKGMSAFNIIRFLEDVFLRSSLPVTSTLWKSALEGVIYSIKTGTDNKSDVAKEIDAIYSYYPYLIMDDMTTKIYLLRIFTGKRRRKQFAEIRHADVFLTVLELSQLITQKDLFESDMLGYLSLMERYHNLNTAMFGKPEPNETYGHFIEGCARFYKPEFTVEMKRMIVEMGSYVVRSRKYSNKLESYRDEFRYMTADLEKSLGVPVDVLQRLL